MRSDDLFSERAIDPMARGAAVMETPERSRVYADSRSPSERASGRLRRASGPELNDDLSDDEPFYNSERRSRGVRSGVGQRLFGWVPISIPETTWGRIAAGLTAALTIGGILAVVWAGRSFLLHDERFVVPSASAIEITGNTHIPRAEVLSVFGGDIERNIFNVSLRDRRGALEALPWVEHATVMRLLPDHLRVALTERTPVAFVREGATVGLVDRGGVLLTMPVNAPGDLAYSFPVVTGLNAADPLSTRAARMKLYARFTGDLDSTGEHISEKLSEVDLSDPEDVKALIPEGATDILVHFGESDFLARYEKFIGLLPEWKTQYPKLASVDMRYERQVVLEMQPGSAGASAGSGSPATASTSAPKSSSGSAPGPAAKNHSGVKAATNTDRKSESKPGTSAALHVASPQASINKAAVAKAGIKKAAPKKPWVSQWRLAHPNAPPLPAGWRPGMPVKAAAGSSVKSAAGSAAATPIAGVKP